MAPRLKVLVGSSTSDMVPITSIVNSAKPYKIFSNMFEGEIVVNIKGLRDVNGEVRRSAYFERDDKQGITWSIQVQGRFLVPHSANDILFGNIFERPLKLPWGTSAVLKFMHLIDPTLEHDLMSQTKPWALSPLISTMPHFAHKRLSTTCKGNVSIPDFSTEESVTESMEDLHLTVTGSISPASSSSSSQDSYGPTPASSTSSLSLASTSSLISTGSSRSTSPIRVRSPMISSRHRRHLSMEENIQRLCGASQRRSFFASEKNRKSIVFGPEDLITTDFCYGFINFAPTLSLQLPGGLSFDLMRYWDGQPVRFVCCKRKQKDEPGDDPWGRIFWCVAIEIEED